MNEAPLSKEGVERVISDDSDLVIVQLVRKLDERGNEDYHRERLVYKEDSLKDERPETKAKIEVARKHAKRHVEKPVVEVVEEPLSVKG